VRLKLLPKFVLILTLLALIPLILVGLRTIQINREGMQAAILELHTNLATHLAENVQSYLANLESEINYIQKTISGDMSWSGRQAVLQALLDTNENFVSVSIVGRDGDELLKAYNPVLEKEPKLETRSNDQTFTAFWKKPKTASISGVYFKDSEPRMNIIFPLESSPAHCLYTSISLQNLWNNITRAKIGSTGFAFLVDEAGRIIAHPDITLAKNKTSAAELPIVRQVLKAKTVGSSEFLDPATKKDIVGAYSPIKALNWGVIIQQDKQEAYFSVYEMQKQAVILIIISLLAAAGLAYVIARGLTRPLLKLNIAAKSIAQRDFSTRVTVNTHDELQDLAETFNEMTSELERYDKMQIDKIVAEKMKTEAVIFSIAEGILMLDREGRILLANKHAQEVLNLPQAGWEDRFVWEFIKTEDMKNVFTEIIQNPTANLTKEVDLSTPELARFYAFSAGEVKTPERNEKIGLVTVLRNITLEKELDKMKEDFLHSITHDLRNPMTSIRGFLKFLIDGVGGPITAQQKQMLGTMDRASLRLLVLINDILDIAKLEAGKMTLSLSAMDIRPLAGRVIELHSGLALKKLIKVVQDFPENLPLIQADPELIERVLSNLLANALKFTPENGEVSVKVQDVGNDLRVEVKDTGDGIPSEYIDKIFDKFQQVAGQRKGGTGLGLTICKNIIEAHLGRIWAESKLGEGAKFIFTIPRGLTPDKVNKTTI
jgi:signal transduction histidine kinase